jgi:hypothetical protein
VILAKAGKDATSEFEQFHKAELLIKYESKFCIGELEGLKKKELTKQKGTFGDMIPYGDPNWYQGFHSPYYNETHQRFRVAIRKFIEVKY